LRCPKTCWHRGKRSRRMDAISCGEPPHRVSIVLLSIVVAMGRRTLHKIEPDVDLTRQFRLVADLPRPWDPVAVFGRAAPLEIEFGSGKGLFLRSAAAAHPDVDYLGVELAKRYARHAAAGLVAAAVPNAVVAAGDAAIVMDEVLPEASAAAIHVYFPDPWWKRRHRKRRVLQDTMVRRMERLLAPGGTLHFWTDVLEYFETAQGIVLRETRLQGPFDVPQQQAGDAWDYRTHFERRTRLAGKLVFRCEFRKPIG
jgi:tRNA (guanine-N7-)-methyltransferase